MKFQCDFRLYYFYFIQPPVVPKLVKNLIMKIFMRIKTEYNFKHHMSIDPNQSLWVFLLAGLGGFNVNANFRVVILNSELIRPLPYSKVPSEKSIIYSISNQDHDPDFDSRCRWNGICDGLIRVFLRVLRFPKLTLQTCMPQPLPSFLVSFSLIHFTFYVIHDQEK